MRKKRIYAVIVMTIAVIAALTLLVGFTIRSVDQRVTQYCFSELDRTCTQLAEDLREKTDMDRTILSAMAAIIASSEDVSYGALCTVMNSYNTTASYISYVELLLPDNTLLDSNGTVRDVSGSLDFEHEAAKGAYISGMCDSTRYPGEKVVRNAVPVIKDGRTQYILFGTVMLSDFAKRFTTDSYDGHAYVYLLDGETGNFLVDTWHGSLGNVSDFQKRTMLPGYSFDTALEDMRGGRDGDLGFISNTTGQVLYMHYTPVGFNSWNVIVTVEQDYAMSESKSISSSLYHMAGVCCGIMLLYMVCVSACLIGAYRQVRQLGTEDQTTGLLNRNAYDKFISDSQRRSFSSIACVYVDANGLHEINNRYGHAAGDQMLRIIADALKGGFKNGVTYRIGGDEFVVFCENCALADCAEQLRGVKDEIERHGYSISAGIVCREKEMGVDRITREADELMLEDKRRYYAEHDRRDYRS